MKRSSFWPLLCLGMVIAARPGPAAQWPMRQRDVGNTGRADFTIPASRLNTNLFNAVRWQKPSPGSPNDGNFSSSAMVFFDGAGPGGTDLVVSGYHWPKGVQGMDRHTGALFWSGNPGGGESIGNNTPAFSTNGATIYVINDDTANHPLMAFAASDGPAFYWSDGDTDWWKLSGTSPKVAPDGRIFTHNFGDRPYGGTDDGTNISVSWSAASSVCSWIGGPALWQDTNGLMVVSGGRCIDLKAWDGMTGAELWTVQVQASRTDADPTIDPDNGNVYLPVGENSGNSIWAVGLHKDGTPLWTSVVSQVFQWQNGLNNRQLTESAGCLAHDGQTYYFQTVSQQGDGQLYAIRTSDGALKWSLNTGSKGWDAISASPIVTSNGVIIVGNNDGGIYFAVLDAETNGLVIATLPVADNGNARSSATLSSDGLLYLPARLNWAQSNGDNDPPTQHPANVFTAFDLSENPNVPLPAPSGLRGRPLNASVALQWTPISSAFAPFFDHYAIYRATNSFSSVTGMVALAVLSNSATTGLLDSSAANGIGYFYAVTTVPLAGEELKAVRSIGPFTPYDETDLQVVTISRTPRFPRYAAQYIYYETNEPSGFGPYGFTAATGLGNGQTTNTARWPTNGQPVTYTATVRNRGSNPWSGVVHGIWLWDGVVVDQPTTPGPLAQDSLTTFTLTRPWDGQRHSVEFRLADADARTNNNNRAIDTKSVACLSFVDQTYYENFRASSHDATNAATDDFFDWANRHMDRFNQLFAEAGCPKRVHLDVLEMLADNAPDPAIDTIYFAIFPFRFHAGDGSYRGSGYYDPAEDVDYGYLHEMGHQLGLIDLYQMDVPADANLVSHQSYSTIPDLMHGVSHLLSPHSALAMTHWEDQAHGYFGQYLYGLPAQINLRLIGLDGQPLRGATVKMYQYCSRPGIGQVITTQIKAQGVTDTNGVWALPNVPLDHNLAPPLPTGDVLNDNPFGYVAVIGNNGVLHFRVEHNGFTDYAWLDITEPNVAFYQGQTNSATLTRQLALGGTVQYFPPADLAKSIAGAWLSWADSSSPGATYTTNDFQFFYTGNNSLKFVTDGGFDTYVRYPGTGLAQWDLTPAQFLNIRLFALNSNGGFQNGSPWVRLEDADGNYIQYQYFIGNWPLDILNEAIGQWRSFSIPLDASPAETNGWRRTAFGSPDLTRIQSLEIHMDTWGNSFTVWFDGVSFEPPLLPPLLSTAAQPNGVLLTWPSSPIGFVLESVTEVSGAYTNYTNAPVQTNGTWSVLVPTSDQQRFFRLRK